MLFSGGQATLTTGLAGADEVEYLPLSGQLEASNTASAPFGPAYEQATAVATQVLPSAATFTSLYGQVTTNTSLSLVGTTVFYTAQLFRGSGGGTPVATPVLCSAFPPLTGLVPSGTVSTFACNGFNVPFIAGDTGYVKLSAETSGISLFNAIPVQATISLASE